MITPFTEVIFIDEADESVLDISDWKILTQGGYTAHDIKFQTAKPFMNRCTMLITAQRKLDSVPQINQPWTDACERIISRAFQIRKEGQQLGCKSMPWNAWVAKKANEFEGDTDNEQDDTDSGEELTLEGLEGILKEDKKEAIRSLSLSSPLVTVVDSSDEDTSRDSTEEAG